MKAALLLLAILVPLSPALAQDDVCETGKALIPSEAVLARAADAVAQHHSLNIVVLGTGSSTLPPPAGEKAAYPARLQVALAGLLPGIGVKVVPEVKSRQTAAEMLEQALPGIAQRRPALIIWQTGTVDAIKGVDPEEFRSAK